MSKDIEQFEKEIRNLRHCYRSIEAPPYLASRIRHGVQNIQRVPQFFRPAVAALAIAVLVIVTLPFTFNESGSPTISPKLPSMTTLSRTLPDHRPQVSPSFSQIQSVNVPMMPAKPGWKMDERPQTHNQAINPHQYEEKYHEKA